MSTICDTPPCQSTYTFQLSFPGDCNTASRECWRMSNYIVCQRQSAINTFPDPLLTISFKPNKRSCGR